MDLQLFHPGTPLPAPVAAALHGQGQLIRPAEGRHPSTGPNSRRAGQMEATAAATIDSA